MKIEIEIDVERIHRDVVERITTTIYMDAKNYALQIVKETMTAELRKQARDHAVTIIENLELPDGRSFKQYVLDLLTKPAQYRDRPRIVEVIDEAVRNHSKMWWEEIFKEHMPNLKHQLQERMLGMTLSEVLKLQR